MGKCTYKFGGKEYSTREELLNSITTTPQDNLSVSSSIIVGDTNDLIREQSLIEAEAEHLYGTSEFISFDTNERGDLLVNVDNNALEGLTNGEMVVTLENGEKKSYDIGKLIRDENKGKSIPKIVAWDNVKMIHFHQQELEKIENSPIEIGGETFKEKLYSFAQKLGISVQKLDDYLSKNNLRDNANKDDIKGLADLMQKVIAIANENDVSVLIEEVAHFAIEYMKDQDIINKMLDKVIDTSHYAQYSDTYRETYRRPDLTPEQLERKVRKEVLGKILADRIADNFDENNANNSSEIGIINQLRDIWEKFLDLFRINEQNVDFFREFGAILDEMSTSVLENNADLFEVMDSQEVFYSQLKGTPERAFRERIMLIDERLKSDYRSIRNESAISKNLREQKLDKIREDLTNNAYSKALLSAVSIFENDVKTAEKIAQADPSEISEENLVNISSYSENFNRSFDLLNTVLKDLLDIYSGDKETIKTVIQLQSKLGDIRGRYFQVETKLLSVRDKVAETSLQKLMATANISEEKKQEAVESMKTGMFKDINYFTSILFSAGKITNPILRAIHHAIGMAANKVYQAEQNYSAALRKMQNRLNIKQEQSVKLLKGNYFINPFKRDDIEDFMEDMFKSFDNAEERLKSDDLKKNTPIAKEEKKRLEDYLADVAKIEQNKNISDQEKTIAKRDILDYHKKKLDLDFSEGVYTRDFFDSLLFVDKAKTKVMSASVRSIFLSRNVDRAKILSKARVGGEIDTRKLSQKDLIELENIERQFQEFSNEFYPNGQRKEGEELRNALQIKEYFENNYVGTINSTQAQKQEFDKRVNEFDNQIAQARTPQERVRLQNEKERWLSLNGIYKFNEDVEELMEEFNTSVIDVHEAYINPNSRGSYDVITKGGIILNTFTNGDKAVEHLDTLPKITDYQEIAKQSGYTGSVNDKQGLQELYEFLLKKKSDLIRPYRQINSKGEIRADLIEDNEDVKNTITEIENFLKVFRTDRLRTKDLEVQNKGSIYYVVNKKNGTVIRNKTFTSQQEADKYKTLLTSIFPKSVPNRAFNKKLEQLKNTSQQEYNLFLDRHTTIVNGERIVTTSYYRKLDYESLRNNATAMKLGEWQPNLRWRMSDNARDINPKYEKSLQGKAKQYNFNKMQELGFIEDEYFELFGVDKKSDDIYLLRNKPKRNQNLFEYRQFFLDTKLDADEKAKIRNQYYQLPAVLARLEETSFRKDKLSVVKAGLERAFVVQEGVDDDVTGSRGFTDDRYRFNVPMRYHRKLDRETRDKRSKDVGNMFGTYVNAAYNFHEKNKILPDIEILKQKLSKSVIGNQREARDSYVFKMLDKYLSVHLYGNLVDESKKIALNEKVFGKGKSLSIGKGIKATYGYLRNTNLAMNPVTPVVGAFSTVVYNALEGYAGNVVTPESLHWSSKQVALNSTQVIADIGSNKPISMGKQLMEYFGVGIIGEELYRGATINRLYRSSADPLMVFYKAPSTLSALQGIYMTLDAYRLYEGRFIHYNQFVELQDKSKTQGDLKKEWGALRTVNLHSFLEKGDGELKLKEDRLRQEGFAKGKDFQKELNKAISLAQYNARSYWNKIESQAIDNDKPLIYSNPYTLFLGMHSQYFFNALQNWFAGKDENYFTGMTEEGRYITIPRIMMEQFKKGNYGDIGRTLLSGISLGLYAKGMEGLEQFEKGNIKRAFLDLYGYATLFALFVLSNLSADEDEDDKTKQYLAYVATRALVEQGSQMMPFALRDIANRVASPVSGATRILDAFELKYLFSRRGGEVIEDGGYEGLTKRQRSLIKATFLKNFAVIRGGDYRKSNLFFKGQVIPLWNEYLNEWQDDE